MEHNGLELPALVDGLDDLLGTAAERNLQARQLLIMI